MALTGVGKKVLNEDLIWLTIAVYLGGVVQTFFTSLTKDLLSPLFFAAFGKADGLENWSVSVGGQKLLVGDLLTQTLNLALAVCLVVVAVETIRLL